MNVEVRGEDAQGQPRLFVHHRACNLFRRCDHRCDIIHVCYSCDCKPRPMGRFRRLLWDWGLLS